MLTGYKLILCTIAMHLICFIYLPKLIFASYLEEKLRIINASAIRLRSNPQANSTEISRLSLGTVVTEIGKSEKKEKIGTVEDFWYQVVLSDGKQGWVFGGFTESFEPAKREQVYVNLLNNRLKAKTSFSDQVDLVNFIGRAITEVKTPSVVAELELDGLLALRQSVQSIQSDKQDGQQKNWLKKHEAKLVYSEPSGEWEVRSELFWDLQKKYNSFPIADQIAWEAAKNTIPGECEGYSPCYIGLLNITTAQYLQLYPKGKHAEEALADILDTINTIVEDLGKSEQTYSFPNDADSRKDLQSELKNLRGVLSKLSGAKIDTLLKHIDLLSQKFK